MSNRHEPHDTRASHSRRHDSFHRSHDDHHHSKPSVGHLHRRHPEDHYESYRQHPSHSGVDMDRTKHHRHSSSHTRRIWPPRPYVEDESVSLRREVGGRERIKAARARDEVPCRGKIDQEHLIDEVYDAQRQYMNVNRSGIPTPPTSEDERARKAKRRPSKIMTDVNNNEVPDMSRRTASPYAFTRQPKPREDNPITEQFLSPSNPPQVRSERKSSSYNAGSRPSSPRSEFGRLSPTSRKGKDYFSSTNNSNNESAIDDSDLEQSSRRNYTGRSSRSNTSSYSSVVDFANQSSIRKLSQDDRRNTDNQNSFPPPLGLGLDKLRKPGTWGPANDSHNTNTPGAFNLRPDSYDHAARSREPSYSGSRAPSPTNNFLASAGTPPRSPRMSMEAGSREASAAGSRVPSVSGSRPTSPSPRASQESPRLPPSDHDWNAAFAANAINAAKRTKPPSRLSTSMHQESVPDLRRSRDDTSVPSSNAPLPYPEDDSPFVPNVMMPSERDHQYFGVSAAVPSRGQDHRSNMPPSLPKMPPSPSRPTMHRGYSTSVLAPPGDTKSPVEKPRKQDTFATSSQTKKELASLFKKGLPPCSRPEPVKGYDDWYTVIGASNLDFCPDCVSNIFERTIFRPSLRLSPPRNLDTKVQCSLGSSWNRIAWLLTLQQQRTDLNLLKDLSEIEKKADPCPGNQECVRQWHGLRDPDGLFVRDFHICTADVRKLERLLPSLMGVFDRLPSRAANEKRICALRPEGNRFRPYMDALIATHDKAIQSAPPPISSSSSSRKSAIDPMPLIDLIEHKTRLRECARDTMLMGATWHIVPGIPTLTVCEDCFDTVVVPELRRLPSSTSSPPTSSSSSSSPPDLGPRLHRSTHPTPSPNEGKLGSSCQLYSRRMRKAFRRAIEDDDVKYLARKSRERRDAELRLQERFKEVMRRAKRLEELRQEDAGAAAVMEERLSKELVAISEEWKREWE